MSEIRRRTALSAGALLILLAAGCAGRPRPQSDFTPTLPAAESRRETASPAARDALDAGLAWIAADAPATQVGPPGDQR